MFHRILKWYVNNTSKIVFLLFVTVVFTLTFVYIPYINILFSSWIGMLLIYFLWYLLFSPKLDVLLFIGVVTCVVGFIFTILGLAVFSDKVGEFFYFTLLLLFLRLSYDQMMPYLRKRKKL